MNLCVKYVCPLFLLPGLLGHSLFGQTWISRAGGTVASLRGVSAVNTKVVWASGSGGTWLRTVDGGATWQAATVPGADALDFRGVRAIDERTAFLMSSGSGDKSRIYKTTDSGVHWTLLFTNPDPNGFFDAIAFRDAQHGIVAGDPVDGHFAIFTTEDGGIRWVRQNTPPALPDESSFAASNSCLFIFSKRDAWLATGGASTARVLHSPDDGRHWTVAETPIRSDGASSGIFSLAFSDARHGVAVGGDYTKDTETLRNIAVTSDGGLTWMPAPEGAGPKGFRSAVAWLADRKTWLATGTSGSDISTDGGKTWKAFDSGSFNALGVASSKAISSEATWAVGSKGRIAVLRLE
jgi:photosystem II stability/assembly factor-like uncharacterized protein